MLIGERIRAIRDSKKLSQGDIERRCGLLRAYLSRVENGHTVPSVETLEKLARALEIPLYQLFYEGEMPPESPNLPRRKMVGAVTWGRSRKEVRFWNKFFPLLTRINEADRRLLLQLALKMSKR